MLPAPENDRNRADNATIDLTPDQLADLVSEEGIGVNGETWPAPAQNVGGVMIQMASTTSGPGL